jgi:beta-glucosidase
VAQLYISDLEASAPVPIRQLAGFQRIHLAPKEKRIVTFQVKPQGLAFWHDSGKWVVEPGEFEIAVGGCQPSGKYTKRSGSKALTKRFHLIGKKLFLSD